MALKAALLCSLALIVIVQECDAAIKCVRCSYLADADPITEDMKKCLPDAENTPVVTCANDEDVCTVTISWTGDGDKSYYRDCGKSSELSNGKKNACDSGSIFNVHTTLCVCDKAVETGCNGASSVSVSAAFAVVSAVCALAWSKTM